MSNVMYYCVKQTWLMWDVCRLPLARRLTEPLQVLYWGGEVMLIWGWYNGPEVTGDLMRGTWHWNAFCASLSAHANDCEMEEWDRGTETGSFPQKRLRSLWKTESVKKKTEMLFFPAKLKIRNPCIFLFSLFSSHWNSFTAAARDLKGCCGGVSWMID